jgi:TetR/AcrR family transcriptional regulator, cholesterol catabolism regulator
MPRNRRNRTHEEKSSEIVAIARRLFLERGYDGTTMAAIAREAGIATNVVHWYFATKDELFVAALDSLQSEDLRAAEDRLARSTPCDAQKDLENLLTEFVWRRLDRYGLIATLHERSHQSSVMAAFHERVHRRYEGALGRALTRLPIPAADRRLVVEALVTAVEGLVMHRASKREARRMMTFLAQRLAAAR